MAPIIASPTPCDRRALERKRPPLGRGPQPGRCRASSRHQDATSLAAACLADRFGAGVHSDQRVRRVRGAEEAYPGFTPAWTQPQSEFYPPPTSARVPILQRQEELPGDQHIPSRAWGEALADRVHLSLADSPFVILRGLPLSGLEAHSECIRGLGFAPSSYVESFIKRAAKGGSYDATANPNNFLLSPHNENVFWPRPPAQVVFSMIENSSQGGGESILLSNAELTQAVGEETIDYFRARGGVRYTWWYPDPEALAEIVQGSPAFAVIPSWCQRFETTDRDRAAERLGALGVVPEWKSGKVGGLWGTAILPATRTSLRTGQPLWFNFVDSQAVSPFFTISNGDNSTIDPAVREHIRNARWRHAMAVRLEANDILVIDNFEGQHGRTPYPLGATRTMRFTPFG